MRVESRFKLVRTIAWAVSGLVLLTGLAFLRDPKTSPISQVLASLMVEGGAAFFFALTVGWLIDQMREAEGFSVLWLFSQEFRKAGVSAFYSDRAGYAQKALEDAFEKQHGGEVLMAGASLRLFLAPGLHFYGPVQMMLARKGRTPIRLRAVSCDPEKNHELPARSFVEEFNQDQSFPKDSPFDWTKPLSFSFEEFEKAFFQKHGVSAASAHRVRVIHDLESVRAGVLALQGVARGAGNQLRHRESEFAPYCTVIIFPDQAFYTPNLLCTEVPVNLPTLVFHKSSDVYVKLMNYAEFLWWSGKE